MRRGGGVSTEVETQGTHVPPTSSQPASFALAFKDAIPLSMCDEFGPKLSPSVIGLGIRQYSLVDKPEPSAVLPVLQRHCGGRNFGSSCRKEFDYFSRIIVNIILIN
jgi:hypothetical protein